MLDYNHPASLLPCLHPEGGAFRLKIRLISDLPADLENTLDPFRVVSDSISYTRLVAASLQTDAGRPVKELFILQQSDEYPRVANDLWPLKNPDIDDRWQNALRSQLSEQTPESADGAPLLLKEQTGPEGRLVAFHPLFFCKLTERFFHPPCPSCGRPLHLCRDDARLMNAGLGGYADSLQRYLYCPECTAKTSEPRYYVPRREPGHPARVADLQTLIPGFGNLAVVSPGDRTDMPCIGCPECSACYGKDDLALKRLAPFAFYPFYAFLYEAGRFHSVDFLSLLGGAPLDVLAGQARQGQRPGRLSALQAARERQPAGFRRLFSGPDPAEQRFLETLYLKLSFLAQLAESLIHKHHRWDDFGAFSLDRVWVSLPEPSGYLPSNWNFTVRHFGLGLEAGEGAGLTGQPPVSRLYFLGQVWFLALLVNSRQEMSDVRPALDKLIRGWCSGVAEFRNARFQEIDPVFHPGNVFFAPAELQLSASVEAHWKKALEVGATLLVACLEPQAPWPQAEFRKDIEALRSEVQRDLFQFEASGPPSDVMGAELAGILSRLLHKWRTAAETSASAQAGKGSIGQVNPAVPLDKRLRLENPQDLAETLIIQSAGATLDAPAEPTGASSEEWLDETVRLKPGAVGVARPAAPPRADLSVSGELPETLIISQRRASRSAAEPAGSPLRPGGQSPGKSPPAQSAPLSSPTEKRPRTAEPDLDDLAETVIIRPEKEGA